MNDKQNEKKTFINNNNDLIEKLDLNVEVEDFSKILNKNKEAFKKKLSKLKKNK